MAEPISLEAARQRLGIVSTHRDAEIAMLISAAREHVEDLAQTVIAAREVREPIRALEGAVRLDAWPVTALTKIEYVDADGLDQEIAAADVRLGRALRPHSLEPKGAFVWPVGATHAVAVLQAGFAGTALDPYPPKLIQAILALVGCWFEDHEGARPVPVQVRDLCHGFRRVLG